ncbi:hypothetical protein J6590_024665 [Homalodisca vitripennis]|nr:hypothetical protein J6590_024665 [Homalodisca vitripennis]
MCVRISGEYKRVYLNKDTENKIKYACICLHRGRATDSGSRSVGKVPHNRGRETDSGSRSVGKVPHSEQHLVTDKTTVQLVDHL